MQVGDLVLEILSRRVGTILNMRLEGMPGYILVRFRPESDGHLVPRTSLTLVEEIARGNVEQHLGDVAAEYETEEDAAEAIYDEAYTLGFDALVDAGVDNATAREVARRVAMCYAQP